MKLAIHHHPGSYSEQWIPYCIKKQVDYIVVNAFDSDIVDQIKGCDAFLWHHHHAIFKDVLAAKNILFALEHAGIKVYPDFKTGWHFDNKVAQKYLLEAINAPLVPSYIFYDKHQALEWLNNTSFPKVFKLTRGAGSNNVVLVKSKREGISLINKCFRKGFAQFNKVDNLKQRVNKFKNGRDNIIGVAKGIGRLLIAPEFSRLQGSEKGYAYFQDFIPNNSYDTRVVIIANKIAAAERRFVREDDFRASGSGLFSYEDINLKVVETAFDIAKKLKLQSVAFDFIEDENSNPLIVEMSYAFGTSGIKDVPGFWDTDLNWYTGKFHYAESIIDSLLEDI